jgi:hypothetical protein
MEEDNMLAILLVIGLILLALWVLGLLLEFISGPILWIILAAAVVLIVWWLIRAVFRRT